MIEKPLISKKRTYYDNFEFCEFEVDQYVSGWLDPQGNFYPCKWGKHTSYIYDLLAEKGQIEEFWECKHKGFCQGARGWVVQAKGWILLNNPYGDKNIQVVVFNPLMRHTKRQLKALETIFMYEKHVVDGVYEMMETMQNE